MALSCKILINHNLKRCICSSIVNYKQYASREGKVMMKLLKGDVGKRKWYEGRERKPSAGLDDKTSNTRGIRRQAVLNKLFMLHITDQMATGPTSEMLLGKKIEITHVKVTPDFNKVLVYWATKNPENEAVLETILKKCAYNLRHELTQLRVIGQVPMIEFLKNRQIHALSLLQQRMNEADYGEDYEPTIVEPPVRQPEITLVTKLPPEVREKILKSKNPETIKEEQEKEEDDDSKYEVNVPEMRHDIFGLDHPVIMNRVLLALNKSKEGAKNRLLNVTNISPLEESGGFVFPSLTTSKQESEAFSEFLLKRQLDEKRRLRRETKDSLREQNLLNDEEFEDHEYPDFDEDRDDEPVEEANLDSLKEATH